jgi:hypothetical protein
MAKKLEEDPNYLIVSIVDYVKEVRSIGSVAGIFVGIESLLITTVLILSSSSINYTFIEAFYQYVLPLIFLFGAFFSHLLTITRQFSVLPFSYLYHRAQERTIDDSPDALPQLKSGIEVAKKNFNSKLKSMSWGNSFFFVSILILTVTILFQAKTIQSKLESSSALLVISFLLLIIFFNSVFYIRQLFGRNRWLFSSTINIKPNEPPQFEISVKPLEVSTHQPAMAQPEINQTQ